MRKIYIAALFLLNFAFSFAQFNLGNLKDKIDNNSATNALKNHGKDKLRESLDNSRKEFDESNFNYAISFIDNSGTFENSEKGSSIGNTISNGKKFYQGNDISNEDKAYTNNRNGELFMATNKFHLAESSFKQAKFFYETAGNKSGLNYSQVISNLCLLYQSNGRYTKAKPFSDQALELRKDIDPKTMYAVSLNNKGVLLKDLGEYTQAEKYLNDALAILKQENDELGQALVHNNLAMAHTDMAKLNVAETDMQSSIEHAAKVLKDNSSNYIKLQINQANILRLQKKYPEAEKLYLSAIAIKEKKLGAHPDLAHLKRGLAGLYMEMGKTADVEKLLLSAVDIDKRKLGDSHPSTLSAMQDLGNFYRYTNNIPKSLELLKSVVEKKKTIYGEKHPNYIQSLEDLALTQWLGGQIAEAKTNYQIVIDNTQNYINTFFNSLNDNEKTLYWEKTNTLLHRYYSFVVANYTKEPALLTSLYNTLVNTKGFLLNTSSKIRNAIASSGNVELQSTYNSWLETKEQLNTAYQLSKEELKEEHINVDSLENKANEYERTLSQKSALFSESKTASVVNFESISKTLGADEAAVEIVEINEYNNGFTGKSKYIAVVVNNNKATLVELGDAQLIQETVKTFRDKTINRKPENEAYGIVWKSLDAQLTGVKKLYLSLDGLYHQLSINSLKDASGAYLIDKYTISFVGNTKDLLDVKQNLATAKKPASAFLIGNPAYGANGVIPQLPGTEAEVQNIKKILNSAQVQNTVLIGAAATESAIKNIKSPSILHIATHGYFLADLSEVEVNKVLGVDVTVAKQNPLLRSGVLLANCENVFDENYRGTNSDNGILTAYEALSLNLDKTDLVVLSACETGLGSVKQGEGVFGLQRSFLIAGAKSIIMSLWSVSDDATMQLMTLFYSNYSKSGNKQQAFADAQKQLKTKYKEPFYWAAFVMLSK
ncbi:MAG TPA: CHAT domain-containing tetratricopeptide repeat protein [Bacteroidia bacterium]|jgi:CHAT domain-containing protein|nr:CHAT domain-containing tetratricopeptide repeat protein [Bacteroidia bacterium]